MLLPPVTKRTKATIVIGAVVGTMLFVRCATAPAPRDPQNAIEACCVAVDIGTRVVRWREPDGYDAYRRQKRFTDEATPDGRLRYTPLRRGLPDAIAARAAASGLALHDLQPLVHQFVLHFDVCGTSRQCFKVLHDVRTLSVHFLLDVDGTIYQTLDLQDTAHHATTANSISVGVEIAHPGTFAQPLSADMRRWYERDAHGWRMKFPAWMKEPGVRTPDFVPRPDRPEFVQGQIHGRVYYQFDYTAQQYAALARLCAGLARVFPRLRLDVPRTEDGSVRTTVLSPDELRSFEGILGHFHVQANKTDPGPVMQWERVLRESRAIYNR